MFYICSNMELLPVNAHAPLATWRHHPGARLKLYCAACSWSRTYAPEAVAARLVVLKRGGPMTPISAVAQWVQWPCPACRRMRWVSALVAPASRGRPAGGAAAR
jgi:hypothetical protein